MTSNISSVAIFKSHAESEAAIKELRHADFGMRKLSLIGRDDHTDEHVLGYYNTGAPMIYWGKQGAFWDGIRGWLSGSAFFFILCTGPLLFARPSVGCLVGALEGAAIVGGMNALGDGHYRMGLPKDSIVQYETALRTDKYVVIAHGAATEVARAREITSSNYPESREDHQSTAMAEQTVSIAAYMNQGTIMNKAKERTMPIQLKEENGGRTLAVHVSEKIMATDYEHLVPEFERLVGLHGRLRVLFDMTGFHGWTAGALWQDTKFAMPHFSDIERLAIVGEKKWQEGMATFCKPFTKATVRYFDHAKEAEARQWLAES